VVFEHFFDTKLAAKTTTKAFAFAKATADRLRHKEKSDANSFDKLRTSTQKVQPQITQINRGSVSVEVY
jgi:hypothetical protein